MSSILRKRKIIDGPASRGTFGRGTGAYGKVTKPGAVQLGTKRKSAATKEAIESDSEREHEVARKRAKPTPSKKRRRDDDSDTEGLIERSANVEKPTVKTVAKGQSASSIPATPRKKAKLVSKIPIDTPTKGARTFLENFGLSSPKKQRLLPSKERLPEKSSTKCSLLHVEPELEDLIALHTAFLNALALHYAHHGTASPADLRSLIPSIERRWGKRRVTTEDFQRLLAIQQDQDQQELCKLSLVEYSTSRTCIKYESDSAVALPIDTWKESFISTLTRLSAKKEEWPLAPIIPVNSSEKRAFSKGALRLQDINAAAVKGPSSSGTAFPTPPRTPEGPLVAKPANRVASLLDRIRNKEALAANLPAPPSPESVARRTALMRLEEIIPILEILSGSKGASVTSRNLYSSSASLASLSSLGTSLGLGPAPPAKVVSFTMANVVQHLQNSLKHPISKEEADKCIRLLAEEVMPRWVSIKEMGKLIAVAFRGKISRQEWIGKVKELLLVV